MTRFDAYEVSPVVETDADGLGGMVCEAFPSFAEAEQALTAARAEGTEGRMLWTLYGHATGEGAEAISDHDTEAEAFRLLYRITGITGTSGTTLYPLS